MKLRIKKTASAKLRIDEKFASLSAIDSDGSFIYEFRFFCSPLSAVEKGANIVRISVNRDLPKSPRNVFTALNDSNDTKKFLDDVLTIENKEKDARRSARANVVAASNADITSVINNSIASDIGRVDNTKLSGTKRMIALKKLGELKKQNIAPPLFITQTSSNDVISTNQAKKIANDLLTRGIDPSSVGNMRARNCGAHSAFSGTFVKNDFAVNHLSKLNDLAAMYNVKPSVTLSTFADNVVVPVIVDSATKESLVQKSMRLPTGLGFNDFFVTFDLVDRNGVVQESITKSVQHSTLLKYFNTPKVVPSISIAPAQFSGKNVIELKQNDNRATGIRLFRKRLTKNSSVDQSTKYELVAELALKKEDGLIKFVDIVNNSNAMIYRCISVGQGGLLSSEFSSVVATPVRLRTATKYPRTYSSALNVKTVASGLTIAITSLPSGVVAASVMRRDLTLHENEYSHVDGPDQVRLVGQNFSNLTFFDKNVKQSHVYEYTCKIYFDDGLEALSTSSVLKQYVPLTTGSASVEITNLQVIKDSSLDIRFDITSKLSDEGLTQVQKLLEKQGLLSLYESELKSNRAELQKLIAHAINRIDVTTGVEESFGVFDGTSFSDVVAGARVGVSKLQDGHKYRYVISTLVRDSETLFKDYKKPVVDTITGRTYSFKPATHRHPFTLARGTIVNIDSVYTRHPEDAFMHGNLGNVFELDVTLDVLDTKLLFVDAVRIDRRTNSIQWTIDGDSNSIDHFIVQKELLGQSYIVGKVHNISQGKTFEFFDTITPDDIGDVSYRITPVLSTYALGHNMMSNTITISDVRESYGS